MVNFNLNIDGNYLLYRDVFILHRLKCLYDLEALLLRDFNTVSNAYPFQRIYFISDSKRNWRKDLYPEYKGKRKKDLDINWEYVFDTFDKFKESIKNRHNVKNYQIDPFEGDDLIAHVITESNKKGISNMILSNDGDLHQLLTYDTNKDYINLMYNYKFQDEKVFMPDNYKIFLNHIEDTSDGDIFNLNYDIDFMNYFTQLTSKATIVEVNKEWSYFSKIVSGDSGDNILSVARIKGTKRGIGKKGAETVYAMYKEMYPETIIFDGNMFKSRLSEIISIYKKNYDQNFIDEVYDNIDFSRTMTRLDEKYLPFGYKEILNENIII